MKVQVLVAAMNQTDHSLLEKMNIQSDVIVGNQCDRNEVEDFAYGDFRAQYYSFRERGVGLNRNNALMRADGDICLFADDDMVYEDGYADTVRAAFEALAQADVILFNLREKNPVRYVIPGVQKIHYLNYLRYGTARMAFRLKPIKNNAIYFNECFGGGTEHSHGEDNLFLSECLSHGLRVYAVPQYIAALTDERESYWDRGYDDKYLRDQGDLYRAISRRWWRLLCLQDAIRHASDYKRSWRQSYVLMTGENPVDNR